MLLLFHKLSTLLFHSKTHLPHADRNTSCLYMYPHTLQTVQMLTDLIACAYIQR